MVPRRLPVALDTRSRWPESSASKTPSTQTLILASVQPHHQHHLPHEVERGLEEFLQCSLLPGVHWQPRLHLVQEVEVQMEVECRRRCRCKCRWRL